MFLVVVWYIRGFRVEIDESLTCSSLTCKHLNYPIGSDQLVKYIYFYNLLAID